MKKKLLSLLLSLSLCASLLPAALAEEEESYSPPPQKVYDPDTMRWGLDTYVEGEGVVTILPKEYEYISSFTDGFAVARKIITSGDDWHYDYCLIDQRGNFVLPLGKYDNIDMGEDGIALVRDLEGLRAYFRPADSAFITDFCFLEDYPFHQLGVNKKLVDGRELYGAVDRNGNAVIPFAYDYISAPAPAYYAPHILHAQKDGKYGAFNYDGSVLRRCIYPSETAMELSLSLPPQMSEEEEMNALIAASQTWEPYLYDGDIGNGLWGYKATQYDTEYPPSGSIFWAVFASAEPFDETGHAQVTREDGTVGTIDQSGNFTPAPLNDRFSDVLSGCWYDQGVTACAERGVMVGTGEGLFSPALQLTDPECLTLALRLYDLRRGGDGTMEKAPADAGELPTPDKWYRDAVYTAYQWGLDSADGFDVLVDWCTSTSAPGPTDRITFARALAVAAGELEKFFDVPRIPDLERSEYNENIYSLYEAGILNGTDSFGTFQADKELTRAECAVMVARVLDPTQRLTTPPATPSGYEQAVIDLRTGFTYIEESEKTYESDTCTVFVYDRGGAMYSPKGNVTLIYKPGSALGNGTRIDCPIPNPMSNKHREPPEVMGLSDDGKSFTYVYYYDDSVHTCVVDLATGQTVERDDPLTYENQLTLLTQGVGYTIEQQLEAPGCTVFLRWKPVSWWDDDRDYRLDVLPKDGGKAKRLLLPSTAFGNGYSWSDATTWAPDSLSLSGDGTKLVYSYYFPEALEYYGELLHEAGEYTYTADLATGEVTAKIDPASQQNLTYHGILGSLETEEGYESAYSLPSSQLPDGVETILRHKAAGGDPQKRDYEFYLLRRDAQPQLLRLPLPSTELLPDGSAPTTREPDSIQALSDPADPENKVTVAYTYRFTEQLWNGNTLLHDKGTYTYTVDVATGEQSVVLEDSYWKALDDAIQTGGTWRIDHQLETPLCTILVQHSEGGTDDRGNYLPSAHVTLIFKEGSPNGAGEVVHLPVLSGTLRYGSIPPHRVWLSEDKTVFTYVYQFDTNQYATFLSGLSYLNLKAGTYTYTVDLAAGTVEESIELKEE